jgi:hypothetical protein
MYGRLNEVIQGIEFITLFTFFKAGYESGHHRCLPGEAACFHFEPYAISCAS